MNIRVITRVDTLVDTVVDALADNLENIDGTPGVYSDERSCE